MKKLLIVLTVALLGAATSLSIIAARHVPTIRRNVVVGLVPVGKLTPDEAARKLRIWWQTERSRSLSFQSNLFSGSKLVLKLTELGISLDDQASVANLPMEDFWDEAKATLTREEPPTERFAPIFTSKEGGLAPLKTKVDQAIGGRRPATAKFVAGVIVRSPEVSTFTLDEEKAVSVIVQGLTQDAPIEVPLVEAPKNVPDEELGKIVDVVSEFSTKFPRSKTSRNNNIKNASSKLDGLVLMPGETFSFNGTVGKRTIENGFKLAGVYKNGKHDLGIGGGICQVSSTLYNAALMANLKIVARQNHSMPVPYLPVGRDATLDFGGIDLKFQNSMATPIAVSSEYTPGLLTFRILGVKDPAISVKILCEGHRSWDAGVTTVKDASLGSGKTKVIEKGSRGHAVTTYRLVFRDGVQIAREHLGNSYYRGGKRIVAVGPAAPAPKSPETPGDVEPPDAPPPL